MVMSFVCALFVAIIHANKDDASKRPRIPLPPTMAFLEDIVKQAKPETSEQAAARKAALPAHNQKMREAAAAAAERYKNGDLDRKRWWGQRNREELPRSRVKLTEEQVEEIDRQKAASRAEDQADKIAMKHRDLGARNRKEEALMTRQLHRIVQQSKDCGEKDSEQCKKMRSTFDLDGDGKMTMVEMKKKTEDMMAEMRVSSQRKTFREPPYTSRDSPDMPRPPPTKEEMKMRDLANRERKKQDLAKKADRNANDEDRSPLSLEDLKRRDLANLERKKQALAKKADRNANDEDRAPPSLEDLKRRDLERKQSLAKKQDRNSNDEDRAPPSLEDLKRRDLERKQALAKKQDRNSNDKDRAPPSLEDLKRRDIERKQALAKKQDRNSNDGDRSPPSLEDLKRKDLEREKEQALRKSDRNANDDDRRDTQRAPNRKEAMKLRDLRNRMREQGEVDRNANDGDRAEMPRSPSKKEAMKRGEFDNRMRKQESLARRAMSGRNDNDEDRADRNDEAPREPEA